MGWPRPLPLTPVSQAVPGPSPYLWGAGARCGALGPHLGRGSVGQRVTLRYSQGFEL